MLFPVMVTLSELKSYGLYTLDWRAILAANGGVNADVDKPFPLASLIGITDLNTTLEVLTNKPEYSPHWHKFAVVVVDSIHHLMPNESLTSVLDVAWNYAYGDCTDSDLTKVHKMATNAAGEARSAAQIKSTYIPMLDAHLDAAWAVWEVTKPLVDPNLVIAHTQAAIAWALEEEEKGLEAILTAQLVAETNQAQILRELLTTGRIERSNHATTTNQC